jgi:glycerate 2-kinase
MAEAVVEALGGLVEAGVAVAPRGMGGRVGPVEVLEGDHPVPGEATLESSLRLLEFIGGLPGDAVLLVLVSGGGSALFEVPAEGLSLGDVAEATRLLMEAGADIYELNAVRKHLSAVKGGQLLRYTRARPVIGLYMSDVPGDRLDTIASGPTVPDPTTYRDAYEALRRRRVWDRVPAAVRERILRGLRGEAPETPKPGNPLFRGVANHVVARNRDALEAASRVLAGSGLRPLVLTDTLRGEAREAAKVIASLAEAARRGVLGPGAGYTALLAGGETTVTVRGRGRGGRSQELCLSLALEAGRLRLLEPPWAALCAGTDGVDGRSPVAGAVVDHEALAAAESLGLDPRRFLDDND